MAVSIHTKRVTKPFMASVADIRTISMVLPMTAETVCRQ